ncbi:hypothetical protein FHX06_004231 [Rhizobium sp. BK512]|uniref:hypothetical protein n=1 Tax=Rhizobium sp. BK512 TaxID=2587010 RepID=UPI00161FF8D1|nr:hypothetical protein [Rhizobium sp. BK512]MBB3562887.1 hypothetical protein [Rhizobium sp. BK512]
MTETKAPKPESLEAKFHLLAMLPYDKRAKRKHSLVFGFILDWYHSRYGDALASVRHVVATIKERDPAGVGLYAGDVHSALTDLVAWGYLTQQKGSGRTASRYVPVWEKAYSVHKTPNTTEDEISVRENQNTSVRETPNANGDSVHKIQNEDPPTGPGLQTREHVVGNMFDAAPVAPPAVGLEATAAGPASGDRFAEFWKAWPRKHGKAKAAKEWKKITHAADLVSHVIATARIWADHYAKHGVDMKWIPEPANWLAGERWDEDLPLVHIDAKGAAITKAKANAPAKTPKARRRGPRIVDIVDADVDQSVTGSSVLILHLSERDKPSCWEHRIIIEDRSMDKQRAGQKEFGQLMRALGLDSVDDSSELCGLSVTVSERDGELAYAPAPSIELKEAA